MPLRRKSVWDLREGRISRETSYLVVTMRFYPRGIAKELVDEYRGELAPEPDLFAEFKELERKLKNHNLAFDRVRYEERFALTREGIRELELLVQVSRERDVTLICQCRDFDRCHCDLMLLTAKHRFGADVQGLLFDYPVYRARIEAGTDIR